MDTGERLTVTVSRVWFFTDADVRLAKADADDFEYQESTSAAPRPARGSNSYDEPWDDVVTKPARSTPADVEIEQVDYSLNALVGLMAELGDARFAEWEDLGDLVADRFAGVGQPTNRVRRTA